MNIKVGENIGKSLPPVTSYVGVLLGDGSWAVEYASRDGAASVLETWDIEDPEQLLLHPCGALIYVDNHGVVSEIIGAAALVRVGRLL